MPISADIDETNKEGVEIVISYFVTLCDMF